MKDDYGNSLRVSALLDIDAMAVTNVQHTLIKRVNRRVEKL
jgi:hypothetical protein